MLIIIFLIAFALYSFVFVGGHNDLHLPPE